MINRIFYNGKVYYKVADLADLFGKSVYKMRKIVKEQGLGAPLEKGSGFGRVIFVLEENVAKIDLDGRSVVVKTKVTETVKKFDTVVEQVTKKVEVTETPVENTANQNEKAEKEDADKTGAAPSEEKVDAQPENKALSSADETAPEELQHQQLVKQANAAAVPFAKKGKMSIVHDTCDKHLGAGKLLKESTSKDNPKIQLIIAELKSISAEWEESPNEMAPVNLDGLPKETESTPLNNSSGLN